MFHFVVFCFAVLAGVHGGSKFSDDEKQAMHALLKPIAMSCMEKFGVDPSEFEDGKKRDDADPCMVACVLRGTGSLDDKGMFDKDGSLEFIKKAATNEDSIKEATDFANICDKVNKEEVSDGAEGCERAVLIVKCFKELKSEIELQ